MASLAQLIVSIGYYAGRILYALNFGEELGLIFNLRGYDGLNVEYSKDNPSSEGGFFSKSQTFFKSPQFSFHSFALEELEEIATNIHFWLCQQAATPIEEESCRKIMIEAFSSPETIWDLETPCVPRFSELKSRKPS